MQRRGNYKIHVAPSKHARKEWQGNKATVASMADKTRTKRRKCLHHPAMECPTPDQQCIFSRMEKTQKT
ncbi:hypothetical protein MUO69_01760 [Candidatus Bathyarchaeota archaeon]|nr:hypothetical protein [Candidatus Bathyarchaeota archaeon]